MPRLLIIGQEKEALTELRDSLFDKGFTGSIIPCDEKVTDLIAREAPEMILIEMDENPSRGGPWGLVKTIKEKHSIPVIALIDRRTVSRVDDYLHTDDFIMSSYNVSELVLRITRLIREAQAADGAEIIKSDGMVIDLARCEVSIYGRRIDLTFKEYELLTFLAGNKGRVFSRESLLNKVWGYDYFGGDRTVDTHIRRLRSKTDAPNNTFIETVRNVGYRFRQDV